MKHSPTSRVIAALIPVCLILALAPQTPAQAPAARQGANRGPTVISPEVLADHKVTFRIIAPKASEVTLRGDWMTGPAEKLTKGENDIWSVTVGPLIPDLYTYSFTVDGVKTIDPRNPTLKPGVAGSDSMVFVRGEESAFQDNKPVAHGQIRQMWYRSGTLDSQRRMHVYTPPGYDGSSERYPVLYLLHGAGDEDSGWSTVGRAGFILDNLLAESKAKPMIIVMPNGSMPRPANMPTFTPGTTPSPEAAAAMNALQDRFTNELMKEVIPNIEKNFRVLAEPKHRAIAGLSMGGGQTLRVITSNPDQFAQVAIWSAGLGRNAEDWEKRNEAFLSKSDQLNGSIKVFDICVGDKDFALNGSKALSELLTKRGIKHRLHISGGGHTWINWRQYLHDLSPRLFAGA
jgi:enterochelin esterase family protein